MSVQIGAGEINGTRHVVRTSTGKVYVVMENAGGVEVWQGQELSAEYYFDGSVYSPSSGSWTDDVNCVDGSTATYAFTDLEDIGLTHEGTTAPGSGDTILLVEARVYSSTNGGEIRTSIYETGVVELGSIVVTSGTPGWSSWTSLSTYTGGWTWAKIQGLRASHFGVLSGDDHRAYKTEIRVTTLLTTPTTFAQLDAGNSPSCMADSPIGVDIDSDDRLHICYVAGAASVEDLDYVTFDTVDSTAGDDLFNTPEEAISMEDADNTSWGCAIAIDSNDIPHAVVIGTDADKGIDIHTLWYDNRIGGAWADRREIEGVSGVKNVDFPDIAINSDNFPIIVYVNTSDSTLDAVEGNANDPTAFATREVDGSVTTGATNKPTIAVDSNGDAWVAYVDGDGTIDIAKQSANWTDAWTITSDGDQGLESSIVADGTDIYVFYEDDNDDIVYNKYDGSWAGEVTLQTGTYNSVKARWAFLNNASYDTFGIDYIFDDGTNIHWDNLSIGVSSSSSASSSSSSESSSSSSSSSSSLSSSCSSSSSSSLSSSSSSSSSTASVSSSCSSSSESSSSSSSSSLSSSSSSSSQSPSSSSSSSESPSASSSSSSSSQSPSASSESLSSSSSSLSSSSSSSSSLSSSSSSSSESSSSSSSSSLSSSSSSSSLSSSSSSSSSLSSSNSSSSLSSSCSSVSSSSSSSSSQSPSSSSSSESSSSSQSPSNSSSSSFSSSSSSLSSSSSSSSSESPSPSSSSSSSSVSSSSSSSSSESSSSSSSSESPSSSSSSVSSSSSSSSSQSSSSSASGESPSSSSSSESSSCSSSSSLSSSSSSSSLSSSSSSSSESPSSSSLSSSSSSSSSESPSSSSSSSLSSSSSSSSLSSSSSSSSESSSSSSSSSASSSSSSSSLSSSSSSVSSSSLSSSVSSSSSSSNSLSSSSSSCSSSESSSSASSVSSSSSSLSSSSSSSSSNSSSSSSLSSSSSSVSLSSQSSSSSSISSLSESSSSSSVSSSSSSSSSMSASPLFFVAIDDLEITLSTTQQDITLGVADIDIALSTTQPNITLSVSDIEITLDVPGEASRMSDVEVFRGEAKPAITATYANNLDVSAAEFTFSLKDSPLDVAAALVTKVNAEFDVSRAGSGVVTFPLSSTDTDQEPKEYIGQIKTHFSNADSDISQYFTIQIKPSVFVV